MCSSWVMAVNGADMRLTYGYQINRTRLHPYPTNRVVGTIADAQHADVAVKALMEAGFDRNSIDVLNGEEDLTRLDPTGTEHGVLERLQRAVIRTGGPVEEYRHLMRHVDDVRARAVGNHGPGAETRGAHHCR